MNLRDYEGKTVRLHTVCGSVYEGRVSDWVSAEDNTDFGFESVILDISGEKFPVEFPKHETAKIEIL